MVNIVVINKRFKTWVSKFAKKVTDFAGSWLATVLSVALILAWLLGGLIKYGFSLEYQEFIGTITNTLTFVMVFLLQHTQNRESKAIQIKLDELILKTSKADNSLINIEDLSEEELIRTQERYKQLAEQERAKNK